MPITELLLDVIVIFVCLAGVLTDIKSRTIPNALTLPAISAGVAINALAYGVHGVRVSLVEATPGAVSSMAGLLFCLVVFGLFGAFGAVGWGDVKLVVAVGALKRWPFILPASLYIGIAGALIAVAVIVARRRAGRTLRRMLFTGSEEAEGKEERLSIPYALPIAAGTFAGLIEEAARLM